MAKKVLIISSSPRKGGNSDMLCDEFMKGVLETGNEVEKIFLKEKVIHPCTGCSVCSMYGKPCPQKDDAAEIVEKMIAADVIVMATPVYFYTMCGQMKIMIDRCCARYTEITNNEIKFLIGYFRITCATTVNHYLHLPGHGVKIDRSCHYNHIGSNHLLHDFRCIILLRTRFTVHTANTASRTRMNRFVFQKNLLYFIARLDSTFHKFITKQIRITTFTWTGRNYQNFFSHNFLLLLSSFRINQSFHSAKIDNL